jgi:ABC-type transport system substrate-binding protein
MGGLLKRLRVPVVGILTQGAFARDPLYNCLQIRKVQVSADVKCLLTPEEIEDKSIAELDAMIDKLMTSPSVDDQKAAYAELEKWQAENLYIMPMYYQPIWLVTTDKISHNLDMSNLGNPQFDWDMSMHEWTLK